MKQSKKENMLLGISLASSVGSLIMLAVSVTWFAGLMDKRISILEKELSILRAATVESNTLQDKTQARFQEQINSQLSKMENKIERIHTLVAQ